MRFLHYINEIKSKFDIGSYLTFIKNNPDIVFWRGISYVDFDDEKFKVFDVNKDRKPQATNKELFKLINVWLEKNGFCRRDSAVFCLCKKLKISSFGKQYPIIPIGDFRYTYVKAHDFNDYSVANNEFNIDYFYWLYLDKFPRYFSIRRNNKDVFISDLTSGDYKKYVDSNLDNEIEIRGRFNSYKKIDLDMAVANLKSMFSNSNISEAKKNIWEVWIQCDKYIVFDNINSYSDYIDLE